MFVLRDTLKRAFHPFLSQHIFLLRSATFTPCVVGLMAVSWMSVPCACAAQKSDPLAKAKATANFADLTGTVSDANGAPLPGVTVYVYTAAPRTGTSPFCPSCYVDCGKHQLTNAQGRFRIPSVATSLLFRLLLVREGYEPTFVPQADALGEPLKASLKKEAQSGHDPQRQVVGYVHNPLGLPVVGATIEPVGMSYQGGASYGTLEGTAPLAVTNARGEFTLRSPRADAALIVRIEARGLARRVVSALKPGQPKPQEIALADGTTIEGRVQNTTGKQMSGVTVQIVPRDRSAGTFVGWYEVSTQPTGKFSIPNIPAEKDYVVCVRMDGLAGSGLAMTRHTLTTGKNATTQSGLNLVVAPAATLAGKVSLTDGKPIPAGTRIMLGRAETWDVQQAVVTSEGSFVFEAVPQEEDLELTLYVPDYEYALDTPGYDARQRTVMVKIPKGSAKSDWRVSLTPTKK